MAKETVYLGAGTVTLVDKSVTPNVPVPVLALSDASIDFSFESKELMGENQFAIAVGRISQKATIKAKTADINGVLLSKLLGYTWPASANGGEIVTTVSASAAASVTPTVPGSGTWAQDLGVKDHAGNLMTPVTTTPSVGSYSVSAGVYTFNASETGTLSFRFAYTVTTGASSATVSQSPAQAAPTFEGLFGVDYTYPDGTVGHETWHFYCLASTKLNEAKKRDNYTESDLEFMVYARPSDGAVYKRTSVT